jgi:hypothetical protein
MMMMMSSIANCWQHAVLKYLGFSPCCSLQVKVAEHLGLKVTAVADRLKQRRLTPAATRQQQQQVQTVTILT